MTNIEILQSGGNKVFSVNKATYSKMNPKSIYTHDYYDYFIPLAYATKNPNVLVIGLGGGTIPIQLLKMIKQIRIDAVEPDKDIVAASWINDHYLLGRGKFHLIVTEGEEYIKSQEHAYDLIIIDAFVEYKIPEQFLKEEFLEEAKRALKSNGILAVNYGEYKVDMLGPYTSAFSFMSGKNLIGIYSKLLTREELIKTIEENLPRFPEKWKKENDVIMSKYKEG